MTLEETEAKSRSTDHVPVRRCVATGETRPQSELLRFVVAPDGVLVPDLGSTLPGRGLWIKPTRSVLERACRKNLFARAARAPVIVVADLPEQVDRLLARRSLELVGMARRAGVAFAGFEKVRALVEEERAAVVLFATDAGAEGERRLRRMLSGRRRPPAVVRLFTAGEQGALFGRDLAVFVGVAAGRLSARLGAAARRLECYRAAHGRGGESGQGGEPGLTQVSAAGDVAGGQELGSTGLGPRESGKSSKRAR